jgi:DNA-binding response OmpR family regulator
MVDHRGMHILCVESDDSLRASRCAVLESAGYHSVSASPKVATTLLSGQKFDLVVLSGLNDFDLQRIVNLADGAEILVLTGFIKPPALIDLVAEKIRHYQSATADRPVL